MESKIQTLMLEWNRCATLSSLDAVQDCFLLPWPVTRDSVATDGHHWQWNIQGQGFMLHADMSLLHQVQITAASNI